VAKLAATLSTSLLTRSADRERRLCSTNLSCPGVGEWAFAEGCFGRDEVLAFGGSGVAQSLLWPALEDSAILATSACSATAACKSCEGKSNKGSDRKFPRHLSICLSFGGIVVAERAKFSTWAVVNFSAWAVVIVVPLRGSAIGLWAQRQCAGAVAAATG
jgi:hypothetical protein